MVLDSFGRAIGRREVTCAGIVAVRNLVQALLGALLLLEGGGVDEWWTLLEILGNVVQHVLLHFYIGANVAKTRGGRVPEKIHGSRISHGPADVVGREADFREGGGVKAVAFLTVGEKTGNGKRRWWNAS